MRKILVLNPKGGCGKSTLATNIASYFAVKGHNVALADFDPQKSSEDWLARRPKKAAPISLVKKSAGKVVPPRKTEILVIDSPAAVHGKRLTNFIRSSKTIVVPILPSEIDIRAAERFIEELHGMRHFIKRGIKLATVANRVREDTLSAARLDYYLAHMKIPEGGRLPFLTVLRNSQNYIKAAEKGLGIFEISPAKTTYDREQLQPLMSWLSSSRSLP